MMRSRFCGSAILALFLGGVVAAEPYPLAVPPETQVSLLLKILTFDRCLAKETSKDVVIVVTGRLDQPESYAVASQVFAEIQRYEGQSIAGRKVHSEIRPVLDLLSHDDHAVDVLYLAPGLDSDLNRILEWSRRNQAFTFTGFPAWESKGIGIWLGGDVEKPRILINLRQVRAEGRELDARLLAIATVKR